VAGYINILQQRPLYDCVPGICRLKAAAACFLSDLFHLLSPYATETGTSPEPPCDTEVAVLLENMVNRPDITLEQIAEAINYSTRHTARLIKNIYGASLSEIRRSRKNK
jgi:AraC-like DNA-binding protein